MELHFENKFAIFFNRLTVLVKTDVREPYNHTLDIYTNITLGGTEGVGVS